ncbi:lysophospholipid acyltransferase family protein [Sphingoaurantiacus capsulatus]|uniref:Lysophospholipid acyltransferase family protein n=1 Tax=Sphingoaurantiacus capsulatus TaxID=1771310 RepID=A0ABV7X8L2_9SPHN
MNMLRSILFAILFYLGSAIIVPVGAVIGVFWAPAIRATGRWWSTWFRMLLPVLGIRVVIRGEIPQHSVIIAAKHQSAFETIATLYLWDFPAVVLKAELMRIPFWGYVAQRHGSIPVERDASTKAMRTMMRAAEAAMAQGRPIIIFPEGSRMPVGEAPPLKPGVSGLYKMLKLPVVPIALDSGKVWPRNAFVKRPGTITIDVGETIPAGLDRKEFEARLHAAINKPLP